MGENGQGKREKVYLLEELLGLGGRGEGRVQPWPGQCAAMGQVSTHDLFSCFQGALRAQLKESVENSYLTIGGLQIVTTHSPSPCHLENSLVMHWNLNSSLAKQLQVVLMGHS